MISGREHKALARQLIAACGGLEESARACRVGKSQLGAAQDPHKPTYLPADVIHDLELYCGRRIYSARLAAAVPVAAPAGDLMDHAVDLNTRAAAVLAAINTALADGAITPREQNKLLSHLTTLGASLRATKSSLEAPGTKPKP